VANLPLSVPLGWVGICGCCALIITKLEAKRMKAVATVSPIAKAGEIENEEDNFFMLRTWDRFQNKIRL
jgi:hypothetical protein